MSDQDSNPKQTGRTPRCLWCEQGNRPVHQLQDGRWIQPCTLAEENAQLRKALASLEGLFSDGSPFYIAKVGNRITNGDQDVIDKAFMLAKAALEQK